MLWFKHYNNQSEGETEARILTTFGLRGYGAHCLILEVVTQAVDTKGCCEKTLPVRMWVRKTQMTRRTFLQFIVYAQTLHDYQVMFQRMSHRDEGTVELSDNSSSPFVKLRPDDLVTIRLPKMLDLLDESTRKRTQRSGTRPDSFASDSEKKRKKERKEETPRPVEPARPQIQNPDILDEAQTELRRIRREGGMYTSAQALQSALDRHDPNAQSRTDVGSGVNGKKH